MEFSSTPPAIMHIDINSCFATVEQQANPLVRGKPVVVAAYTENHGCILAASIEAKKLGIKTGMRVREARLIESRLIVLPPDPEKYRFVNRQLRAILETYTPNVSVESIDEMVMDLRGTPDLPLHSGDVQNRMISLAQEIKARVRKEIGEWMSVSVGIAPNRYLAKVGSGMKKPDGLVWITSQNIRTILGSLQLEDLCGIKEGNATRLRVSGITSPLVMLGASPKALQVAFRSIVGYHWWMRLHGYEDGSRYKAFGSGEGATPFAEGYGGSRQKSFGQSHALSKPYGPSDPELWQVLSQLVMKMARRLRKDTFSAKGVGISLLFADRSHFGLQHKGDTPLFADADFYERARILLSKAPDKPVRILGVSCFDLAEDLYAQESLFEQDNRKQILTQALDKVHDRYGDFVVTSGRMLHLEQRVLDRIAFGKIRDLAKPMQ
jgi:DNA polymerase-4